MKLSSPAILLIGTRNTVYALWRSMMFCPFCGSQNRDGKKFCRNCGKNIPPPKQVQLPSWTPPSSMQSSLSSSGVTGVGHAPVTGSIEPQSLPETVGFEALKMQALPANDARSTVPEATSPFQVEVQPQPPDTDYDLEGTAQLPPSVREQRIEDFQEDMDKTAEVPVLPPPEDLSAKLEDEKTEEVPVLSEPSSGGLRASVPLLDRSFTQPPTLSAAPTFGAIGAASYIPQARPGLSGVEKALIAAAVVTALLGLLIILWFWVLKPTLNF